MHLFSTLLLAGACLLGAATARGESLYDARNAAAPSFEQRGLFGPKAGKFKYDKRMLKAAEIAASRARARSTARCWRYVKQALLAAEAIDSYPKTAYAKQAGRELQRSYGFQSLRVKDPFKAPVGSVLVYGGRGAGHVEFRTPSGFVSDFASERPSRRPLIGVYAKPRT